MPGVNVTEVVPRMPNVQVSPMKPVSAGGAKKTAAKN